MLLAFVLKAGLAQNYNPFVNSGTMAPSPLENGIGECRFNVGNSGSDSLKNLSDPIVLTLTLGYGVPDNANPVDAISGTFATKFKWVYDASITTFQGTQYKGIGGNEFGTIKIAYRVTRSSTPSESKNGFNLVLTAPAYTNGSNSEGDDGLSAYTYGSMGGPLPVKMAYFNGSVNNCTSVINWKSVTEEKFSHYEVEYSIDGINFKVVYKVNGKGGNSIYSVTHSEGKGKAYYRLKMVDVNGKIEYSSIISLDVNCNKSSVLVYPNPAQDFINVNIAGVDNKVTMAQLFNEVGQVMLNKTLQNGTTQLDISRMAPGVYQLKLINSNGTENIQIVKK